MLASRGMRTAFRLLTQSASPNGARSIHIPTNVGRKPPSTGSGGARNVIHQARNAINRLLYGAAGSANTGAATRTFARPLHVSQSIRGQLSLPVKHALNRPFGVQHLPKPPALQRGITQVGLATAKNFSTARPIFQSLAQNVPVTGRAVYQADFDVEKKRARRMDHKQRTKENVRMKKEEMIKSREEVNFDQYFTQLPSSEVTTYLIVPLHPVFSEPTSQNVDSTNTPSLIPARAVSETHSAHTTHALRITSLFLRLDQSHVWQNGAHYEAFGVEDQPFDPQGNLCTSLRIVFDGWTEKEVRHVIGEAGKGWCTLKEVHKAPKNAPMSVESTRPSTPAFSINMLEINAEDAQHLPLVMPTLDFSSSFLESHAPTPFSEMGINPLEEWETASLPASENESEWHWSEAPSTPPSEPAGRGIAFSAEFMSRGQEMMSNF